MILQKLIRDLQQDGFCMLRGGFSNDTVATFRKTTIQNLDQMAHTRAQAHSYHLAGFHRFSTFAEMHRNLVQAKPIAEFLTAVFEGKRQCAIGLSDITVNRSQHWHTDLLRGPFSAYLDGIDPWAVPTSDCVKALVYLQEGKSLRIVRGSHLKATPLDDAALDRMAKTLNVEQLEINAGDVVMMDIRSLHRGSTDAEINGAALENDPKILVSTVFGKVQSKLSQAMQIGNTHRMVAWDQKNLNS